MFRAKPELKIRNAGLARVPLRNFILHAKPATKSTSALLNEHVVLIQESRLTFLVACATSIAGIGIAPCQNRAIFAHHGWRENMNATRELDGRVLANYGIVRSAITAESHLEPKQGIRQAFAGRGDRQDIIVTMVPVTELDEEERLELLELACAMRGTSVPSDPANLKYRRLYINMTRRSSSYRRRADAPPHCEIRGDELELRSPGYTEIYLGMMARTNSKRRRNSKRS